MRLRFILILLCLVISQASPQNLEASPNSTLQKLVVAPAFNLELIPVSTQRGTAYRCQVTGADENLRVRASWVIRDSKGSLVQNLQSVFLPAEELSPRRRFECRALADNGVIYASKTRSLVVPLSRNRPPVPRSRLPELVTQRSHLAIRQVGRERHFFCEAPWPLRFASTTRWWNNGQLVHETHSASLPATIFEAGEVRCAQGPLEPSESLRHEPMAFLGLPTELIANDDTSPSLAVFESESPLNKARCSVPEGGPRCQIVLLEDGLRALLLLTPPGASGTPPLSTDPGVAPESARVELEVTSGATTLRRELTWRNRVPSTRRLQRRDLNIERHAPSQELASQSLECKELTGENASGQILWISEEGKLFARSTRATLDIESLPVNLKSIRCVSLSSGISSPTDGGNPIRVGVSKLLPLDEVIETTQAFGTAWAIWGEFKTTRELHLQSLLPLPKNAQLTCYGVSPKGNTLLTPNLCPQPAERLAEKALRSRETVEDGKPGLDAPIWRLQLELTPSHLNSLWQQAQTNSVYDRYAPRLAEILVKNEGQGKAFWGRLPLRILRINRAPSIAALWEGETMTCPFEISDPEDDHLVAKLESIDPSDSPDSAVRHASTWRNLKPDPPRTSTSTLTIALEPPRQGLLGCEITASDGVLVSFGQSDATGRLRTLLPRRRDQDRDSRQGTPSPSEPSPPFAHPKVERALREQTRLLQRSDAIRFAVSSLAADHFGKTTWQPESGDPKARNLRFCLAPQGSCPQVADNPAGGGLTLRIDQAMTSGVHIMAFEGPDGELQFEFLELAVPGRNQSNTLASAFELDCRSQDELHARGDTLLAPTLSWRFEKGPPKDLTFPSSPCRSSAHGSHTSSPAKKQRPPGKVMKWTRLDDAPGGQALSKTEAAGESNRSRQGLVIHLPSLELAKDGRPGSPDNEKPGSEDSQSSVEDAFAPWAAIVFHEALLRSPHFDIAMGTEAEPAETKSPRLCKPLTCSWQESSVPPKHWLTLDIRMDREGQSRRAVLPVTLVSSATLFAESLPENLAALSRSNEDPTKPYSCLATLHTAQAHPTVSFVFYALGRAVDESKGTPLGAGQWFAATDMTFVDHCVVLYEGQEIAASELEVSNEARLHCAVVTASGYLSAIPCSLPTRDPRQALHLADLRLPPGRGITELEDKGPHPNPSPFAFFFAFWEEPWGFLSKATRMGFADVKEASSASHSKDPFPEADPRAQAVPVNEESPLTDSLSSVAGPTRHEQSPRNGAILTRAPTALLLEGPAAIRPQLSALLDERPLDAPSMASVRCLVPQHAAALCESPQSVLPSSFVAKHRVTFTRELSEAPVAVVEIRITHGSEVVEGSEAKRKVPPTWTGLLLAPIPKTPAGPESADQAKP